MYRWRSKKSAPGFKTSKDRVTLLLCSNAFGNCVITQFNHRALKIKTRTICAIFCDWFRYCFVSEVESYLEKHNLDFKALLVLKNATGHPRELETLHPNIKVTFLPSNTTAWLQSMDKEIIQTLH